MIIKQILLIFGFTYMGEVIQTLTQTSIPGSIIGLTLLFLSLQFKWIKLEDVETVGTWLKNHLAIFFVPITVQIMIYFDVLKAQWLSLAIVLVVTTIVTYLCTYYAAKWSNK